MTRKYAQTYSEHIARYAFAMVHGYRRNVLDIGCGQGFGAHLLSTVAKTVTGVDFSDDNVAFAKKNFSYFSPVKFEKVDLEKDDISWLTSPTNEPFDTVTAFEILEHLENPEFAVENINRLLGPGGSFVFSVPHMVANHEHKVLFDEEKIRALIETQFDISEFYIQDKRVISGLPSFKGLRCYVGVGISRKK